jgi:ATP-dependent exoDNAse (exonuclease V) beta subunit
MAHPQPDPEPLDAEQQVAVRRENQDVCVVAGPGSGKTRVLVERFAWLVLERGCDPERILAITFTEKAANELKGRLANRFDKRLDLRRKVERAQISTIHAFCHAILREHALEAGLDPQFEVLDDVEAAALRFQAMSSTLDEVAKERPQDFVRLAEVWPAADMAGALLSVHDAMRAAGKLEEALAPLPVDGAVENLRQKIARLVDEAIQNADPATENRRQRLGDLRALQREMRNLGPQELAAKVHGIKLNGAEPGVSRAMKAAREVAGQLVSTWVMEFYRPQRELLTAVLRRFDEKSREKRRERGGLDYTDLEEFTLRLLRENEGAKRAVTERYEHILMDELQDTNPLQWEILRQVRQPGRFFAVGDVNQSIYGFRHAEPQLFKDFQSKIEQNSWAVDRLTRNYRTRPEILQAVEAILTRGQREGIVAHGFQAKARYEEAERPYVEVYCAATPGTREEAPDVMPWLAARLAQLYGTPLASDKHKRPARFSDMAVFVRNSNAFGALEEALKRYSIPYVITGGNTFFDAQEVVDLVNFLRVLAFPEDEIALYSLLRSPFFGVSDETLFERKLARRLASPDEEEFLERCREAAGSLPLAAVLERAMDETGYAAQLSVPELGNAQKLLALLDRLEQRGRRDAAAILAKMEALRESANESNAPGLEAGDAVQLMTIHKAKGLQFPIVAVAALEKRGRVDNLPAAYHPESGLGFKWVASNGEKLEDRIFADARERIKKKEELERDRLLYVAMTRPMERLILAFTSSNNRLELWPRLVLEGLELAVPEEDGGLARNGLASIRRIQGLPEAPAVQLEHAGTAEVLTDRLDVPAEAPAEIAVTALATFAQCPRRYLLHSVLHWPTAPVGGGQGIELGTEVHEYLGGLRQEVSEEARRLAQVFERSELAQRAERAPGTRREMDFLVEMEGTLVRGQIDLWFDEGRGPVLVDYKTDQYLDEARTQAYELQLRLYAAALGKLNSREVAEAWLFPLRDGQPHRVDVTKAKLEEALGVLRQWREAERQGEFPARESDSCQWCPYAAGPCPVQPHRGPGL